MQMHKNNMDGQIKDVSGNYTDLSKSRKHRLSSLFKKTSTISYSKHIFYGRNSQPFINSNPVTCLRISWLDTEEWTKDHKAPKLLEKLKLCTFHQETWEHLVI